MSRQNQITEVIYHPLACWKKAEPKDSEDSDLKLPEEEEDEEGLIWYYFLRGFEYKEIPLCAISIAKYYAMSIGNPTPTP